MAYPKAPELWENPTEHLFYIAKAVNGLLNGESNNTLSATLTPGSTTTEISDDRIHLDTVPTLTPKTASAAATVVSFVATKGKLTLTHDSSAATDRSFGVILFG
jgi:hypothetical protein